MPEDDNMSNKVFLWEKSTEKSHGGKDSFIQFKSNEDEEEEECRLKEKVVTYHAPLSAEDDRGGWGNKLDFLFSCISLSVGLGNVWRFPYLCFKNGGGGFLITYTIAMIFCGIPMFFQEVAIGQYLGSGGMTFVGQLCPILKGVGYATMTIVFLLDVYYCLIISWTLFYIITTFSNMPILPWASCDNWWNSKNCYTESNRTSSMNSTTSVEEFFERRVLAISEGIEEIGDIQWNLFLCLMIGWIMIYLVIRKGLHQSGKVIWFSALFPYVVLLIFLVRAVTLEGASDGLLFFITPQWDALLTPEPWMEGATQIFFAYSIGCGALPALGSYNKFHHNSYKDALITCIVNTLTSVMAGIVTFSILGHLALEQDTDVAQVVKSGPGLVFLTYPEVVLKLPGSPFWATIFFMMLMLLGIDSEFCLVESFITGIIDNWSQQLRPYRTSFTAITCLVMFILGIPMVTNGGMYIFQLMDFYSASGMSLIWVCFFQTIGISWAFGVDKLSDCIEQMMGRRPNKFLCVCWKYFAPMTMLAIFVSHCFQYRSLTYAEYKYPHWADALGICISFMSMMWVPLYAIYYVLTEPGSIVQNIRAGFKAKIKERRISICDKTKGVLITQSNVGLITPSISISPD
ncbi:unnamed protein product [Brassicogethes aeneus]|uniref:Transporter n=1 Tax=Brassicogethes aeneus TaxID=1431903 RepID=A0A9P0FJA4_BRAAE|nr:unnamed protein product [Brassicogethes aeneus]